LECGDVTPLSFVSPVFCERTTAESIRKERKTKESGVTSPHSKFQTVAAPVLSAAGDIRVVEDGDLQIGRAANEEVLHSWAAPLREQVEAGIARQDLLARFRLEFKADLLGDALPGLGALLLGENGKDGQHADETERRGENQNGKEVGHVDCAVCSVESEVLEVRGSFEPLARTLNIYN
jgi:hypothetical protein